MLSYEPSEAIECFVNANNLNAAAKKIIKSDVSRDPKTARFAKALKTTLKSPKGDAIPAFVEKALGDYEEHLFLVLRNAYGPQLDAVLDKAIETYADNFNSTYSVDPMSGSVTVTDETAFKDLATKAIELISKEIEAADIPSNNFMKKAAVYSLFDRSVLSELSSRISIE